MMRGLAFREERFSDKARRTFAKIAAGLALVSVLGCGARSPYTYPTRSQYSMSTPRVRQMEHHLTTAPTVTVRGMEARAVDLVLPLSRLIERDGRLTERVEERRTYRGEAARRAGAEGEVSGQNLMQIRMIIAERYRSEGGQVGTFRSQVAFVTDQFLSDDGQTFSSVMGVAHRVGQGFERAFGLEDFTRLVKGGPGHLEGVIITQGLFGTYSAFFVPTGADGRPIGRVAEGQLAFGITYDHQRQEAVGGLAVLRDP